MYYEVKDVGLVSEVGARGTMTSKVHQPKKKMEKCRFLYL